MTTRTMHQACLLIEEQLQQHGKALSDAHVDLVLCEDGETVMIYAETSGVTLAVHFDWPKGFPFDHGEVKEQFLSQPWSWH